MIAIIDYGAGNLGSVYKAFKYIGADVRVTSDASEVASADSLVLPGVGAFTHCMLGLDRVGLTEATRAFIDSGKPFLGICVGLQMLFDESDEMGASPGLGVLAGRVVRFDFGNEEGRRQKAEGSRQKAEGSEPRISAAEPSHDSRLTTHDLSLKIPHIGWNELRFREDAPLFKGLTQGDRVYFVHSYHPQPEDESVVTATTDYGYRFCCAVQRGNVHATQFHPEKSGAVGLHILRNFASLGA